MKAEAIHAMAAAPEADARRYKAVALRAGPLAVAGLPVRVVLGCANRDVVAVTRF